MSILFRKPPSAIGAICWLVLTAFGADGQQVSIAVRGRAPVSRPDFRLESDLVLIPVSVTDAKNHAVTGLHRQDFRLYEDQAEQAVVEFTQEDAPLSIGIVFDSSWSMTGKLEKSREAMKQFLHFANPEDEFFLVEFSNNARLSLPFTNDSNEIQNRLLLAQAKGTTALLDAVCLAVDTLKHARYPRRALLVLSDGGDNHSRYSQSEVFNRIRESDLWIYSMGIYEGRTPLRISDAAAGEKLLKGLADESGGRHFLVDSLVDLPVVAARISLELRNQYILGYHPTSSHRDGKYHQVKVSVVENANFNVAWRPGYYGTLQ